MFDKKAFDRYHSGLMRKAVWAGLISLVTASAAYPVYRDHAIQSPFHRVAASALPKVQAEGDLEAFKTALTRQIARCREQDLNEEFRFGNRLVTRRKWCVETNQRFLELADESLDFSELMEKARDQFEWYQSEGSDGKGNVVFTGYLSLSVHASLSPTTEYNVPLYSKPADLVQTQVDGELVWRRKNPDGTLTLFPAREEIVEGDILKNQGLELAYTNDAFEAFILQVQGSGILILQHPDGVIERRFINYAGKNGQPYVSIGKALKDAGVPEEYLSLFGMRKWFKMHPEQLMPTLLKNPSYVFFKFAEDGPYGTDSVILSPRHSIATDRRVFPQGAVTLFNTQHPLVSDGEVTGWKDYSSLAVNQDTGSAIVGPGRVDIYWGDDDYAEQMSGRMNNPGSLFIALTP